MNDKERLWALAVYVDRERLWYFLVTEVAQLFDDVWAQFAYEGTVNGVKSLWNGGLSTLEDVEAMRVTLAEYKAKWRAAHPEPTP